jgi:16S rRNA (guanine527-N7)-methyltransferase
VIHSRAELYTPEVLFNGILSRAFASVADMIKVTAHLLDKDGFFYAMKAGGIEQELNHLPDNYQVEEVVTLDVPGLESEQRHLIIIRGNN